MGIAPSEFWRMPPSQFHWLWSDFIRELSAQQRAAKAARGGPKTPGLTKKQATEMRASLARIVTRERA